MIQRAGRAKTPTFSGGCLCGDIRFEVTGTPEKPHTCSCRMCQRTSGALTVAWVEFPKSAIRWIGKVGEPTTFRSSNNSSRAFCPRCGSTIGAIDRDDTIALTVGSFDAPHREELAPLSHSFEDLRPGWWHVAIKSTA